MFEVLSQKAREAYKNGKQLWMVCKDPLETALTTLYEKNSLDNSTEYGFTKIIEQANTYRQVFELTLPHWLIHPRSVSIDYSCFKNKKLREKYAKTSDLPEFVLDLIAKKSIESKEKTSALDKKLYDEIDFRLHVTNELPDPIEWVNKNHKWYDKKFIDKIVKRTAEKREREMFVNPLGKLDEKAIDFILKYFGDERISKNIFLVVSSSKIPLLEHENWIYHLFPEMAQK